MATLVSLNGTSYSIPAYGDSGWAQGAGNLSSYLISLASVTLQPIGGNFTLTAPLNFGSGFGVTLLSLTTASASPATAGFIRMASGDTIDWGTANNALGISGTALQWNGQDVLTAGTAPTITENRENYIAGTALSNYTGSLTVINMVAAYVTGGNNLKVYVNGILCTVGWDYTETNTLTVTMGTALTTGDRINLLWNIY